MENQEKETKESMTNLVTFKKLYIGSAEGVSKKGNDYCMVKFLEINRYKNGDIVTLSVKDGKLPDICSKLICGDMVEIVCEVENMLDTPVLVNITKKIADSKLF
jgi:hypothetical protein